MGDREERIIITRGVDGSVWISTWSKDEGNGDTILLKDGTAKELSMMERGRGDTWGPEAYKVWEKIRKVLVRQ